ncbi:RNA polymerase subunit sigma-24 [Bacillus massilinigeriensis]|uniref:RNA polymerase subunit sigma-24 n=1 Tax=Bacillus massilionigeriensis TaxID=1805475 RepID=UPI00096B4B79|nr:RNA polymerase subunit sigma-24 [Bacillus massilionigeriensis]
MNDEQRSQIRIMRYEGIGYKRIGDALGLSRDIIRGYCKRHGLDGRATELVVNKDEDEKFKQKITHVYCLTCGSKLEQKVMGKKRKYCSIECKRKWEKDNPKIYKLRCDYCRKEYLSERVKKRKFCSNDCYVRNRFFKEEDAAEILGKIMKRKQVDYVPKWLEELLLSYIKND